MEIKNIQDIANLDDIRLMFAVRKNMGKGKENYISDLEITTKDHKTTFFENVSLREVLFHLGESVKSAEEMEVIDKYIYEYKKCVLAKEGFDVDFNNPGCLVYQIPGVKSKLQKEFQLGFGGGFRRYETLEELFNDAKEHKSSKRFEKVIKNSLYGTTL